MDVSPVRIAFPRVSVGRSVLLRTVGDAVANTATKAKYANAANFSIRFFLYILLV